MKFARLAAIVAVVGLVAVGLGSCTPPAKVVFATDATFPPMEFVNDDKAIVGFDVDVINAIAKAAGFEVEVKSTAWEGIFAGLENGAYSGIISSVTITDERKAKYDFSNAYVNAGQVLLVPVADTTTKTIDDLAGKTVGTQIGTTGSLEVQKHTSVNLKEFQDAGLVMADLVNGNLAGVVIDAPVAGDYAVSNKDFAGKIKVVGEPMTSENFGIVVKKGDATTLGLVNKGLETITTNGTLAEIKTKWGLK